MCGLCLSTTSAGVRTGALLAMGKLLPAIEVDEARKMMAICGKVSPSYAHCCAPCARVLTRKLLLVVATEPIVCDTSIEEMPFWCCREVQRQWSSSVSHVYIRGCWPTAVYGPLQVISIDRTPGTTMCVIGLGSAVAKQWGTQEGARSALPVMTPCLAVAELTPQQYATAMRCDRQGCE